MALYECRRRARWSCGDGRINNPAWEKFQLDPKRRFSRGSKFDRPALKGFNSQRPWPLRELREVAVVAESKLERFLED
jgi:hypothetical protein